MCEHDALDTRKRRADTRTRATLMNLRGVAPT
jgi:hypothetical protein